MDYYKIGQKIRKIRKVQGLSQEKLAERIDNSTTHMSHIGTGSTKLRLTVFVEIPVALGVKKDELLDDYPGIIAEVSLQEIGTVLERCSVQKMKVLVDIIKALSIRWINTYKTVCKSRISAGVNPALRKLIPKMYR